MSSFFLNPALVIPGLALIALPIVIHLINRMRYRKVRFAAMEFLLASDQRNRRRVLIEQLILLLLRILIVAFIVFLIARLLLDPQAASVFRSAKTLHVVLLDDSVSMGAEFGAGTAFDQAKQAVLGLAEEGARQPGKQQMTLVLLSDLEASLVEQRDIDEQLIEELRSQFKSLEPTYRTPAMTDGLDYIKRYGKQQNEVLTQFHIVSNFRKSEWVDEQSLSESLNDFDEAGLAVNLIRTLKEDRENVSINALEANLKQAVVGLPIAVSATLTNHGAREAEKVEVEIFADGKPVSIKQGGNQKDVAFIESIPAGQTVQVEFELRFRKPGWHQVQAVLKDDPLPADNVRHLALELRSVEKVLVVEGNVKLDENFFIYAALDKVGGKVDGGAEVVVRGVDGLRKEILDTYSSIYLLNIADLPPDALRPLEKYVASGGGLAWYAGPAVTDRVYNREFYRDGEGLFPVPLTSPPESLPDQIGGREGADIVLMPHPIFDQSYLTGDNPFLPLIRIERYMPVAEAPDEGTASEQGLADAGDEESEEAADADNPQSRNVRTIAKLRNGAPLIIESRFGEGRVITVLTSAGPTWNNWPQEVPAFVPFQYELQKYIARKSANSFPKQIGDRLEARFDAGKYTEQVLVTAPGLKRPVELTASEKIAAEIAQDAGTELDSEVEFLGAKYDKTDKPGVYSFLLKPRTGSERPSTQYAYNMSTSQSDLDVATAEELEDEFDEDSPVRVREAGDTSWLRSQTSDADTRNLILAALILLFFVEQFMSYRLSYHTK